MKNVFISVPFVIMANSSALAYELIDLGASVEPKAINNAGVVVGSRHSDQSPAAAFSWSSARGFETIDGTSANAVNDSGQIAGSTITGAFILTGSNYLEWSNYDAFGMNQSGAVTGYQLGSNSFQPRALPYNPAIFDSGQWDVSEIADLYRRGSREGVYADRFVLSSINDSGYSVGYRYKYGLAGSHSILIDSNATIRDKADVTYLPIPVGGKAADINNNNMIVGTTGSNPETTPVIYTQAYLLDYNSNALTILPLLEGGLRSSAYDVNEYNQVVGTSETMVGITMEDHAFLWQQADGTATDLNQWAPAGWTLTTATAINDNGDIVGIGALNGVIHGFLLKNGTI
jgi:probable HAF family extracellular repeat protein